MDFKFRLNVEWFIGTTFKKNSTLSKILSVLYFCIDNDCIIEPKAFLMPNTNLLLNDYLSHVIRIETLFN